MSKKVLFLFTKNYPFGKPEQYIADEQHLLATHFDHVFFVPCEVFSNEQKLHSRSIPSNAEVFDINAKLAAKQYKKTKRFGEFLAVMWYEFKRCADKIWFIRELWRYQSVLRHQMTSADVLVEKLKELGDVEVYCYAYWVHNSAIILGLLKRRGIIQHYICRAHSIDLYDRDWALVKTQGTKVLPFHQFNMEQADGIWAISEHGEKHLREKFPHRANHFATHRLGVADEGTNPFLEDAPFTLVTCSGMSRSKGIHRMIDLLLLLDLPVRWIHFGGGGDREEFVQQAIATFPASIQVDLRGHTPNAEIKLFYVQETVHLFLSLSEAEGIPVSLMEAISFGIPVLATEVYGNPEVANASSGFSVPYQFDAKVVAQTIRQFLTNTTQQQSVRKSAKELFQERFNGQKNHLEFIRHLLQYPNRPHQNKF
jgi:colanic acid/amylovoran biosynthesis glycosyltransferase